MMPLYLLLIFCLLVVCGGAGHGHGHHLHQQPLQAAKELSPKRIAIIGAGSAGASTAYYLRQFAEAANIPTNITVFERSNYVGGRSTTVNVYDDPSQPVELGASIFVQVNRNLVSAVEAFNLSTSNEDFDPHAKGETLGVWNGESFVLIQTYGGPRWQSWWSTAKLLYRYGLAPLRTASLTKKVVARFLDMYEAPHFPWTSLTQVAADVGLSAVTAATGAQYLQENEIGEAFARDVVQASTRVNYAQNLGQLHGLEALVCMATDGAMSVEGGNWQIFDGMLRAAGAHIRLGTAVTELRRRKGGEAGYVVRAKSAADLAAAMEASPAESVVNDANTNDHATLDDDLAFDAVILAAPYHSTHLTIHPTLAQIPAPVAFVNLHVTLFSTPHIPSPAFFNLAPGSTVPEVVLTTLHPSEEISDDLKQCTGASGGVGRAGFFSLSLLRMTTNSRTGAAEGVYKIFSEEAVGDAFLRRLLGLKQVGEEGEGEEGRMGEKDVSWVYRKLWESYPYLPPKVAFERVALGGVGEGLWYTGGIESFISTMETSSLSGMNVARLAVNEWIEEGLGVK